MSREIKFRAFDTHGSKQMVYFDLTNVLPLSVYAKVMQFTGLKDKNGREIYEGDIVKIFLSEPETVIQKVGYDEETACFELRGMSFRQLFYSGFYREIEVIGNIYENPELLAQKKGQNQ